MRRNATMQEAESASGGDVVLLEEKDDGESLNEEEGGTEDATDELNLEPSGVALSRSPEQRLALAFETVDLVLESMLTGNPAAKQAAAQAAKAREAEAEAKAVRKDATAWRRQSGCGGTRWCDTRSRGCPPQACPGAPTALAG